MVVAILSIEDIVVCDKWLLASWARWLERVYVLRCWCKSGNCSESDVGLYIVNGEYDVVAQRVGISVND